MNIQNICIARVKQLGGFLFLIRIFHSQQIPLQTSRVHGYVNQQLCNLCKCSFAELSVNYTRQYVAPKIIVQAPKTSTAPTHLDAPVFRRIVSTSNFAWRPICNRESHPGWDVQVNLFLNKRTNAIFLINRWRLTSWQLPVAARMDLRL